MYIQNGSSANSVYNYANTDWSIAVDPEKTALELGARDARMHYVRAMMDDPLPERLAGVLVCQIAVKLVDRVLAEHRAVERMELFGQRHERSRRRA